MQLVRGDSWPCRGALETLDVSGSTLDWPGNLSKSVMFPGKGSWKPEVILW